MKTAQQARNKATQMNGTAEDKVRALLAMGFGHEACAYAVGWVGRSRTAHVRHVESQPVSQPTA